MKKNACYLLMCVFALFQSCKKSSTGSPSDTMNLIKVKEHRTNTALEGVTISLYTCFKYDAVFGCQSTSLLASHVTDSKGEYLFSQSELNKANEGITLTKSQYWERVGGTGEIEMEPEAWANIVIKASKAYPDTSIFEMHTSGELTLASLKSFTAPKDSTVRYRLFGNETNEIHWAVYTKDSKCFQFCILDTLAHGTLTLNPQKFETLNASIDY